MLLISRAWLAWRRLLCVIGIHDPSIRIGSFARRCRDCNAPFWASYFEWRKRGFPTWRRISEAAAAQIESKDF